MLEIYATRAPTAMAILEAGFDDATAVLALPEPYRRRLRTSNGMERLNDEVRRRERVIRIFPNRESAIRLVGAVLMERHEHWTTGHRYFEMAAYWQWRRERTEASRSPAANAVAGPSLRQTAPNTPAGHVAYSRQTVGSGNARARENCAAGATQHVRLLLPAHPDHSRLCA
jgi:hypothetical protein